MRSLRFALGLSAAFVLGYSAAPQVVDARDCGRSMTGWLLERTDMTRVSGDGDLAQLATGADPLT